MPNPAEPFPFLPARMGPRVCVHPQCFPATAPTRQVRPSRLAGVTTLPGHAFMEGRAGTPDKSRQPQGPLPSHLARARPRPGALGYVSSRSSPQRTRWPSTGPQLRAPEARPPCSTGHGEGVSPRAPALRRAQAPRDRSPPTCRPPARPV